MNETIWRRLIGFGVAILGIAYIVLVIVWTVEEFQTQPESFRNTPWWVQVAFFLSPGVFLLYHGVGFYQRANSGSLKWIVGILMASCAFGIGGFLYGLLSAEDSDFAFSMILLVVSVSAFCGYLFSIRLVMPRCGGGEVRIRDLIGRGQLLLLALVVGIALMSIFELLLTALFSNDEGFPWDLIANLTSLVIVIVGYRWAKARWLSVPGEAPGR